MTPTVIDGNRIAEELKDRVLRERERVSDRGLACGLATVAVGEDYGLAAAHGIATVMPATAGAPA